jgi:ABC-type glycerol-3-phosphate transport system substrate-binding protein
MQLAGAGFSERSAKDEKKDADGRILPVSWNEEGLNNALGSLNSFISATNGSSELQDSFEFKYLFAPGYRIVQSGKILFSAMRSNAYFLLPMLDRSRLEYRYFAEKGKLAVDESIRYAGIPKRAPKAKAAGRFLEWFFSEDTQARLLEKVRTLRLSESQFGIAGGFSSVRKVTETVLPEYYPDMADRVPPHAFLDAPLPMPAHWESIKEEVILPWLRSAAGKGSPSGSLTSAISLWLDSNPDQP